MAAENKKATGTGTKLARKRIPDRTLLQLWAAAGGRCEFAGCNKPVWYDQLTLAKLNVSNIAHIIPHSSDWRRGGDSQLSARLETDFSNLMLVCLACHKRIDDNEEWTKYPEELLRKMKAEHEGRVRRLLDIDIDRKTHLLLFRDQIGRNVAPFSPNAAMSAVPPMYPADSDPITIDLSQTNLGEQDRPYFDWAKREIHDQVELKIRQLGRLREITHLSVFALARQSLLMYLGHELRQLTALDVYDFHRDEGSWQWKPYSDEDCEYRLEHEQHGAGSSFVALNISLSDFVRWEDAAEILPESYHAYTISVTQPRPGRLRTREQLDAFTVTIRNLISQIKRDHGTDCKVHVFPAMPASAAVRFGQLWDEKCHPEVHVYELDRTLENGKRRGFFEALTLCN